MIVTIYNNQLLTLHTTNQGSGDPSMPNSIPLQHNYNVSPEVWELVGGPSISVEILEDSCGYKNSNITTKSHLNRNLNPIDSFVSSSTHKTYKA